MSIGIALAERGLVPDAGIRLGIRNLLRQRLNMAAEDPDATDRWIESLVDQPLAVDQGAANQQHYEVPAAFYQAVLGARMKYSSAWWPEGVEDLDAAEEAMLELTCERAELADGQEILEVGCGWGSLTCYMAEHYPGSRILAISNSQSQRAFIEERCRQRGLDNVTVQTVDICDFDLGRRVDRIVSVECFEHLRNYRELFRRLAGWLQPDGSVFVHVFCHATMAYPFETEGDHNWMGRHFFTGGQMPSWDLFRRFDADLVVDRRWQVDGRHYARTARAWLDRLGQQRHRLEDIFPGLSRESDRQRMFHRWRMFFMACEELFGWGAGEQWFVGHYRLVPAASR